jgi:hypothetical protein
MDNPARTADCTKGIHQGVRTPTFRRVAHVHELFPGGTTRNAACLVTDQLGEHGNGGHQSDGTSDYRLRYRTVHSVGQYSGVLGCDE